LLSFFIFEAVEGDKFIGEGELLLSDDLIVFMLFAYDEDDVIGH